MNKLYIISNIYFVSQYSVPSVSDSGTKETLMQCRLLLKLTLKHQSKACVILLDWFAKRIIKTISDRARCQ